jgi:hypothetical protein
MSGRHLGTATHACVADEASPYVDESVATSKCHGLSRPDAPRRGNRGSEAAITRVHDESG